jgi:hypothetical protein
MVALLWNAGACCRVFNANHSAAFEQQPRSVRVALEREPPIGTNWVDKSVCGAASPAFIGGRLHQANAFLTAAVDVW